MRSVATGTASRNQKTISRMMLKIIEACRHAPINYEQHLKWPGRSAPRDCTLVVSVLTGFKLKL